MFPIKMNKIKDRIIDVPITRCIIQSDLDELNLAPEQNSINTRINRDDGHNRIIISNVSIDIKSVISVH